MKLKSIIATSITVLALSVTPLSASAAMSWPFTAEDARFKLKYLYLSI